MTSITKDQAKTVVAEILKKAQQRFKQELSGENEEFLDRTLRNYRDKVSRISWRNAQKWCKFDQDGPTLMPDGVRIYYRKGNTEILLQEFPPQVRFMKFRGSLANRNNSSESISEKDVAKNKSYSLALPYTIFIFKFVDGMFQEVRCAFSDRPLKKLEETPLRPYLSNIDSNLVVCLGPSLEKSELVKNDVAQQAAFILSHFWHTTYTDEWSSHYWSLKDHFSKKDQRLGTLEAWQEASVENPLFVIENVDWLKHSEESFGDMIVRMMETDKTNHQFQEEMYKQLSEEFLTDIVKTFNESIDSVEEKTSQGSLDQFAEILIKQLQSL